MYLRTQHIPTPDYEKQKSEERKTLELLEVGESFEFPPDRKRTTRVATQSVRLAAAAQGVVKRFRVQGCRVWRVE